MKQVYFAVQGTSDVGFSVIDENNEEIGNFHLAVHESAFGGVAVVTLLENNKIIRSHVINTGLENELDFGTIKTEVSDEEMHVFAFVEPNGKIIVSVK